MAIDPSKGNGNAQARRALFFPIPRVNNNVDTEDFIPSITGKSLPKIGK